MVGVIDYDAGNVKSVMKAVNRLGAEAVLTSDTKKLDECSSLILPGVGSFGKAMDNLEERKLDVYIRKAVKEGRLMLGICLGLQMLFDRSFEEGERAGLGFIPGDVVRFGEQVPADLPRKNGILLINRDTVHNGVGCTAFVGLLQ